MKFKPAFLRAALSVMAITNAPLLPLRADHAPRAILADAVVDLRTTEGVARVKAQWRYSDTTIQGIEHRDVGPDLKASGPKNHTFEFTPDARAADFNDSTWEVILGINGPLSVHSDTYIWIRSATLDFYKPGKLSKAHEVKYEIEKKDPALDTVLSPGTKLEKVADGFTFTEGPVWIDAGNPAIAPDSTEGFLLFSDPNNNVIYRCSPEGDVQLYMTKSGYTGPDIGEYGQPGSNGLTTDSQGRLTICQHGNRRVVRIEKNGLTTVLADRYNGRRLNSPNDLVYRSDGTLFFTDPRFGLPKFHKDPRREIPFSGVYSVHDGKLQLVSTDFTGPNGLAFSPDENFLYVGDWDEKHKAVNRYPVNADGVLGKGALFFDMTSMPGEDAIDGIKVDKAGNVFVSGPGGLWVLSPEGKHLGTLRGPEHPHNMAWGGADRQTFYLAAQTGIYRIRLNFPGAGFLPKSAWTVKN